jgi:hypothetical protein
MAGVKRPNVEAACLSMPDVLVLVTGYFHFVVRGAFLLY